MTTTLDVRQVSVRFGGVTALAAVDLAVEPQQVVGVIGPNEAGKTTLFDVISGARRPIAGQIQLDGHDVTGRSATWRARHGLRRTFQRQQVFGALSVEENLLVALEDRNVRGGVVVDLLGLAGRRGSAAENRRRVDEMIDVCDLGAVRHVPSGTLPVGVARILELARALVGTPRLLLLDEPTSGLGEAEAAASSTVLRAYLAGHPSAVLLIEHDVGFVMEQCDRLVVLHLGRVIAAGEPERVRADPEVKQAYLG